MRTESTSSHSATAALGLTLLLPFAVWSAYASFNQSEGLPTGRSQLDTIREEPGFKKIVEQLKQQR